MLSGHTRTIELQMAWLSTILRQVRLQCRTASFHQLLKPASLRVFAVTYSHNRTSLVLHLLREHAVRSKRTYNFICPVSMSLLRIGRQIVDITIIDANHHWIDIRTNSTRFLSKIHYLTYKAHNSNVLLLPFSAFHQII